VERIPAVQAGIRVMISLYAEDMQLQLKMYLPSPSLLGNMDLLRLKREVLWA